MSRAQPSHCTILVWVASKRIRWALCCRSGRSSYRPAKRDWEALSVLVSSGSDPRRGTIHCGLLCLSMGYPELWFSLQIICLCVSGQSVPFVQILVRIEQPLSFSRGSPSQIVMQLPWFIFVVVYLFGVFVFLLICGVLFILISFSLFCMCIFQETLRKTWNCNVIKLTFWFLSSFHKRNSLLSVFTLNKIMVSQLQLVKFMCPELDLTISLWPDKDLAESELSVIQHG